jgi:Fe-S cluster assembly ATPase SufC
MLRIDNLHATVAGKPILKGISLEGKAGEVLQQLPMEFGVQAQKLLGIGLEGSVG